MSEDTDDIPDEVKKCVLALRDAMIQSWKDGDINSYVEALAEHVPFEAARNLCHAIGKEWIAK